MRIGGATVAVAIGLGAGVVDRSRRRDGPGVAAGPADTTTTSTTSSTTTGPQPPTTTTTNAPVVPDNVPRGVLAVGNAYLAARPDEADLATLLDRLPAPDGDVTAAAAAAITDDFASGDTVVLDGWVLAVSEARAAAVLTLACGDTC